MRVIYSIGAKFAGGGIGTTAYHGVRGLHQHSLLYRLLCGSFRPTEIPREKIRAMGLLSRMLRRLAVYDPTHSLSYFHNLLYDVWASRLLNDGDLFHVWGNHGLRSLRRAKSLGMVTVVQWASSHPMWRMKLLLEEYTRWGKSFSLPQKALRRSMIEMEEADYVLIPSDYVRETFQKRGFSETKLLQIPFGADITRFHPPKSLASSPFRVLFVGTVTIAKGVPYLLETWKLLNWKDAELWIAGRVSSEIVRLLRERYGGMSGLRLLGHQPNVEHVYRQAHVFAFPTIDEGSALVTYEALASGLPVITTPNAGSVVRDGVEGFVVPIRDAEGLAVALEKLRADERLRRNMSRAARARAEEFTWQRHEDTLADTYQRLASRSKDRWA